MDWIVNWFTWVSHNWSLLIVLIAAITFVIVKCKKFVDLPSDAQIAKIKEAMLLWVALAEREFGKSTGALKLRYVYNLFVEKYPSLAPIVPFEVFAQWVDEVLAYFKRLMETNTAISEYVEGQDGESK